MMLLLEARYLCFKGGAIAWAYSSSKFWREEKNKLSTFFSFLDVNAQVHALAYQAVRLRGCLSSVTY